MQIQLHLHSVATIGDTRDEGYGVNARAVVSCFAVVGIRGFAVTEVPKYFVGVFFAFLVGPKRNTILVNDLASVRESDFEITNTIRNDGVEIGMRIAWAS